MVGPVLLRDLTLRTVELDGQPWFVAADVCRCLSMSTVGGAGRWLQRLDGDERQTLRTVELDGQPWFHATDVCRILGLRLEGGTNRHLRRVDEDEKRTITRTSTASASRFIGTAGMAAAVSESGLYKLIMRSDKAEAVEFQNWVTRQFNR